MEHWKAQYPYGHIVILSNSAGSKDDKEKREALEIEKSLGIKVMLHKHKKPNWVQDIYNAFTVGDTIPKKEEILVIGDRITVDIIMGNIAGFLTIHTQPFCIKNENFFVAKSRWIENSVLLRLSRKKNVFAPFENLKEKGEFNEFIRRQEKQYM